MSGKEVEVRDSGSRHHQLCDCHNLQLIQSHVAPSCGPPARVLSPLSFLAKSLLLPKPRGKREHPKAAWSTRLACLLRLGLNPSASLPRQPHFPSSHNRLHLPALPILPASLGCQSKSRQVWPCGVEPIFSKLSRRCCNQGELPPSYILG